ncbi:hypothetical protein T265_04140 [Opisthorchis viverrini]|uniref:MATH domain-containing protein n=1 Tax=Opisthorchis viverrini TaxID=6198 RepID=A0A075A131_OPIVI|nr:hypothetical protein T265_04140 [Opisthorchis viverrini]KER29210.1 hypothetical protein T265_04140 [Opisthorchis viverrini]
MESAYEQPQATSNGEERKAFKECLCEKLSQIRGENEILRRMTQKQLDLCNDLVKLHTLLNQPVWDEKDKHCSTEDSGLPSKTEQTPVCFMDLATNRFAADDYRCGCTSRLLELVSKFCTCCLTKHLCTMAKELTSVHCAKTVQQCRQCIHLLGTADKYLSPGPNATNPLSQQLAFRLNAEPFSSRYEKVKAPTLCSSTPVHISVEPSAKTCTSDDRVEINSRKFQFPDPCSPNKMDDCVNTDALNFGMLDLRQQGSDDVNNKGTTERKQAASKCMLYIWTIPDYPVVEAEGCSYWSDSFYLGTPGYRFRTKLEFTKRFVGIFVQLVAGEFDEQLVWPFRDHMQFVLIDQSVSGRNITRTLKPFPEDEDEKGVWERPLAVKEVKVQGAKTTEVSAWGFHDFVPRSMLSDCGGTATDYVRNDRMYIAIRLL